MLSMSASYPHNFEVKTFGMGSLPNIWIRYPGSSQVDFEITHEDFNSLVTHYLWGGKGVEFEDADGSIPADSDSVKLFAIFEEEDTDPPDATYTWAGLLITNKDTGVKVCKFEESDWVQAVKYIFTNDDLQKDDARPKLLEEYRDIQGQKNLEPQGHLRKELFAWLMSLEVTEGFNALYGFPANPNARRLSPGGV
jgi:hypothetical protein